MAANKFNGTVLALDLATVTGFAWGKPRSVPKFGHQRFSLGGSRAGAYRAFSDWFTDFTDGNKIDLIVYESPAVPSLMRGKTTADTTRMLIGFAENLEEWCYDRVELREATVSQVRSFFIGRNHKSAVAKPMVQERCRQLGWNVRTTDEADACALWAYQCSWLDAGASLRLTPLFSPKLALRHAE